MLDAADPDFLAVDDIAVALAHRGRLELGGVGAGRRLGDAHRLQAQFAARDLRQIKVLLRLGAVPQQRAHIVHLAVAMAGIAAGAVDLLHHHRRLGQPEARAAIFLGDHGGQPAGLGQRVDELDGIGRGLIMRAVIFRRKFRAERAQRLAHLLVAVGLGDHALSFDGSAGRQGRIRRGSASVCSPSAGTGSKRGCQPSPLTGFNPGSGPAGEPNSLQRSARLELRMRPQCRHVADARRARCRPVEPRDGFFGGERGEHAGDDGLKHVAMVGAAGIALEARRRRQGPAAAARFGESHPFAVVLQAEEDAAVGGGVGTVGIDGGVAGAVARRRRRAVEGEVHGKAHPFGHGFQHRDLDVIARAGRAAMDERGEDRVIGGDAGRDVGDRDAGLGHLVAAAGDREEPGLRLDQQIVGLALGCRPAVAIARDRAGDEARIGRAQLRRAEPEPLGGAWRQVLHEHVGLGDDPLQRFDRAVILEVERQAFLRAVGPDEMAGKAARAGVVGACEIAAVGPLDLDDARALVGQQPRAVGRGDRLFQRDDKHTVERAAHVAASVCASPVMARPPCRHWPPTVSRCRRLRAACALTLISLPSNSGDTAGRRSARCAPRAHCGGRGRPAAWRSAGRARPGRDSLPRSSHSRGRSGCGGR